MSEPLPNTPKESQRRNFATTSWSMVANAGDQLSPESRQALECLCQTYWYPLYAFVRRKGLSQLDAEELTQGFFAHLLDRNRLQLADPQKGRFRSFLLRSLENFMIQDWRKRQARKRGGQITLMTLDFQDADRRYSREPVDSLTPERLFDRKWAIQILDQVIQKLEAHYRQRNKLPLFQALKPHLVRQTEGSWREIARELSMNEVAIKVAAHRMRERYRSLLHETIGQTVQSPAEIEQEINDLFRALGSH